MLCYTIATLAVYATLPMQCYPTLCYAMLPYAMLRYTTLAMLAMLAVVRYASYASYVLCYPSYAMPTKRFQ